MASDSGRKPSRDEKGQTPSRTWAVQSDNHISTPTTPEPAPIASDIQAKPISMDLEVATEPVATQITSKDTSPVKDTSPEPVKWQYINDEGRVEGPYETSTMQFWLQKGYLPQNLKVKSTRDTEFEELAKLLARCTIPFQLKSQPSPKKQIHIPSSIEIAQKPKMSTGSPVHIPKIQKEKQEQVPIQEPVIEPVQPVQDTSTSPFNFATLLGISPEEVTQSKKQTTVPSSPGFGFADQQPWGTTNNKVWKVDQIESQWRNPSSSPWHTPLDSPASTVVPNPQGISGTPAFSPWGLTSNDPPVIASGVHSLFSNDQIPVKPIEVSNIQELFIL